MTCGQQGSWNSPMRQAFSLVELLVVTCIVAVLVAVGLSTMNIVYEATSRTMCLSNLRTLHSGQIVYANDWRGFLLPTTATDPLLHMERSYWNTGVMNDYLEGRLGSSSNISKNIYGCRKAREQHAEIGYGMTYGQNYNIKEFKWKFNMMATPSLTAMIGDGAFVMRSSGPAWFEMIQDMNTSTNPYAPINAVDNDRFPDAPHNGNKTIKSDYVLAKNLKSNFVFMDGHVESRVWGSLPANINSTFWKLR